jgi:tetratricopeptide (TPR) repeat protein
MREQAALLRDEAQLLESELGDSEGAIDCWLRAHDLEPTHLPTLGRLVDHYWAEGDLQTVAELGDEMAALEPNAPVVAELRQVHLAIAAMLTRDDLRNTVRWLSPVLSDESLMPQALLELGRARAVGGPAVEQATVAHLLLQVLQQADPSGRAWETAQELARSDPRAEELARLLEAL